MEAVGLAVGVATLFSSVLEAAKRFQDYKTALADQRDLNDDFNATCVLLQRWGSSVGAPEGWLSEDGLTEVSPGTREAAERLLRTAKLNLEPSTSSSKGIEDKNMFGIQRRQSQLSPTAEPVQASFRKKVAWSLSGKESRVEQAQRFRTQVRQLYDLIPPPFLNGKDVLKGIEEILDGIKRENDWERVFTWLFGGTGHSSSKSSDIVHDSRYDESDRKRLPGTCDWVLDRPEFKRWGDTTQPTPKLLWIHGHAGFGKTILCSRITRHLVEETPNTVAHCFYTSGSFSGEDAYVIPRSWIWQLARRHADVADLVFRAREADKSPLISRAQAMKLLNEIFVKQDKVFFLVADGLDECTAQIQEESSMARMIDDLKAAMHGTVRLLLVSRRDRAIEGAISEMKVDCPLEVDKIGITAADNGKDVFAVSRDIINRRLETKPEDVKASLSERMAKKCDGQFLLMKMHEDTLDPWKNGKQLGQAIDESPSKISELYESHWGSFMRDTAKHDKERTIAILRWVALAIRPLEVGELAEAVLIDERRDEFPIDELPDESLEEVDENFLKQGILKYCYPFIEVQAQEPGVTISKRRVVLTHFTIKEFLIPRLPLSPLRKDGSAQGTFENQHENILARLCLRYVRDMQTWLAHSHNGSRFLRLFKAYAATYWHKHASRIPEDCLEENTQELLRGFMTRSNPSWEYWHQWDVAEEQQRMDSRYDDKLPDPLYYAARYSLRPTAMELLRSGSDPNAVGPQGSALYWACLHQNTSVARALLDAGADVNLANDDDKETPIFAIHRNGLQGSYDTSLLQLLLDHGANPFLANSNEAEFFHLALAWDQDQIVQEVLERHPKFYERHISGNSGMGLLDTSQIPAHYWSFKVVQLFLSRDINMHRRQHVEFLGMELTPVELAIWRAYHDAKDFPGSKKKPLTSPTASRAIIPLYIEFRESTKEPPLLVFDTTPVAPGHLIPNHCIPLSQVSSVGEPIAETIQLLLDRSRNKAASQELLYAMLAAAAWVGDRSVVELILAADCLSSDVDGKGFRKPANWILQYKPPYRGSTSALAPLHGAASQGHTEIVKLLVDAGAPSFSAADTGDTPLQRACARGRTEVVNYLLKYPNHGNQWVKNKHGRTALHCAAVGGHTSVVSILLREGSFPNAVDKLGDTPLTLASFFGNTRVVRLLLRNGANVLSQRRNGDLALHVAAEKGHMKILKLLLNHRTGMVSARSRGYGRTPLHEAAENGHSQIAKLLLKRGADVRVPCTDGKLPLHYASAGGHEEVVRLLLEHKRTLPSVKGFGYTALQFAALNGHREVVRVLMEHNRDLALTDCHSASPLLSAARRGHVHVVHLLIDQTPKTPRLISVGESPPGKIEKDARWAENEPVQVTVDITDYWGNTALDAAVRNGHLSTVRALLRAGATLQGTSPSHKGSLISWARLTENDAIVQALKDHAEGLNVVLSEEDLPEAYCKLPPDDTGRYCDSCLLDIPSRGTIFYQCWTCSLQVPPVESIDFCDACHSLGTECFSPSHVFKKTILDADGKEYDCDKLSVIDSGPSMFSMSCFQQDIHSHWVRT